MRLWWHSDISPYILKHGRLLGYGRYNAVNIKQQQFGDNIITVSSCHQ